jgi:biofilm protein TabA
MFATNITLAEKYDYLSEKFKLAYEFLRRKDLEELSEGVIPLELGVAAHIQRYTTKPGSILKFETHDRYFDIQYMASGYEIFELADRDGLEPDGEYIEEKDISYYKEPVISGRVLLKKGDFIIVAPEEAHKPRCTVDIPLEVTKIVVKVPV